MTLDPPPPVTDLDWSPERATAFGTRVLELYSSLLADLPEAPTSPHLTTAGVRAAVAVDVPEQPLDEDALTEHLQAILDNTVRPGSGGFFAYISGGGTVPGAIADLLASGLNANSGGWALSAGPSEVESQLISWLANRFWTPRRCRWQPRQWRVAREPLRAEARPRPGGHHRADGRHRRATARDLRVGGEPLHDRSRSRRARPRRIGRP